MRSCMSFRTNIGIPLPHRGSVDVESVIVVVVYVRLDASNNFVAFLRKDIALVGRTGRKNMHSELGIIG